MGRPRKNPEEKRVQLNIRLFPADRDKLAALAEAADKPLATYAERLIVGHLERWERTSKETRKLTSVIEEAIPALESKAKGKWPKNLRAWAAVAQMLAHIIDSDRPERGLDDEVVTEAFNVQMEANRSRKAIVAELANLGVAVNEDPKPRGLLGVEKFGGLFGQATRRGNSREWERASIDAIPDEQLKAQAGDAFAKLLVADQAVTLADDKFREALQPYIEAEQEGRQIGRDAFPDPLAQLLRNAPRIVKWPYASKD